MTFPLHRLRRLRKNGAIRRLISETTLKFDDYVSPYFVREELQNPKQTLSYWSVPTYGKSLKREIYDIKNLGIPGIIIFVIPEKKDATGSEAWNPDGIVQQAIADCKSIAGDDLVIMSDLCVDEYTDHGHCGVVNDDGSIDNDLTLDLYKKIAVAQAHAGADVIAPSGMMDGQVAAIRNALDETAYVDIPILAYSAKYASGLYGPFREA